jgi:hypothetical protein
MRGRAHLALYETSSTIENLTRAIQLQPRDSGTLLERGKRISR